MDHKYGRERHWHWRIGFIHLFSFPQFYRAQLHLTWYWKCMICALESRAHLWQHGMLRSSSHRLILFKSCFIFYHWVTPTIWGRQSELWPRNVMFTWSFETEGNINLWHRSSLFYMSKCLHFLGLYGVSRVPVAGSRLYIYVEPE
jgi:hypothetical protein